MTASNPGGLSGSATGAGTTSSEPREPAAAGLERSIARLLTLGTYASIALLAIGLALLLASGVGPLSGGPSFDPARLLPGLVGLEPAAFLWAGLLVVVATPSARVAAALVGYARSGERPMAVVAALILVVIALSVGLATGLEA
jgi:uncharacterized membrane protein